MRKKNYTKFCYIFLNNHFAFSKKNKSVWCDIVIGIQCLCQQISNSPVRYSKILKVKPVFTKLSRSYNSVCQLDCSKKCIFKISGRNKIDLLMLLAIFLCWQVKVAEIWVLPSTSNITVINFQLHGCWKSNCNESSFLALTSWSLDLSHSSVPLPLEVSERPLNVLLCRLQSLVATHVAFWHLSLKDHIQAVPAACPHFFLIKFI